MTLRMVLVALSAVLASSACTLKSKSGEDNTSTQNNGASVSNSGTNTSTETDTDTQTNQDASFGLASFSAVVNQNSISVTITLGPNASDFDSVRLTRVQGSSAPSNCEVGTILSTIDSPVNNSVLIINDTGLSVTTSYSYRICYLENGASTYISSDELTLTGVQTGIVQSFCDTPPCETAKGSVSDRTFTPSSIGDSDDDAHVAIHDLNNDGEPDFVFSFQATNGTAGDEDTVETWIKSGASWALDSSVGPDSGSGNSAAIGVADLDNDNNPDVVVAPWLFNVNTLVHWGDGTGGFTSNDTVAGGFNTPTRKIYFADLNGNGFLDILSANSGDFRVNLNNTNKTFANASSYSSGNTQRLLISDFDNDSDQDVIQIVLSGAIMLFKNDGNGGLDGGSDINNPITTDQAICAATGDIDGDGDIDIFYTQNIAKARVIESNGDGTFELAVEVASDSTNKYYTDCILADMDGDGHLDFIVTSEGEISIMWGNGTMAPGARVVQWSRPGSEEIRDIAVADLNGDQILDIIATIRSDSQDNVILYGNAP